MKDQCGKDRKNDFVEGWLSSEVAKRLIGVARSAHDVIDKFRSIAEDTVLRDFFQLDESGSKTADLLFEEDYFSSRASHLLKVSILATNFEKVKQDPWNITTCQDILHSTFLTRRRLSELLETMSKASSSKRSNIEWLIRDVLRPFAMEWHSRLFRNKRCTDGKLMTIPRRRLSAFRRAQFKKDVLEIQVQMERSVKILEEGNFHVKEKEDCTTI